MTEWRYLVQNPSNILVGDSYGLDSNLPQLVKKGKCVDSLVQTTSKSPEKDEFVLQDVLQFMKQSKQCGTSRPSKFSLSFRASTHFMRSVEFWSWSWITVIFCCKYWKVVNVFRKIRTRMGCVERLDIGSDGVQVAFDKVREEPGLFLTSTDTQGLQKEYTYNMRSLSEEKESNNLFAPPSAQQCQSVAFQTRSSRDNDEGWFNIIKALGDSELAWSRRKSTFQIVGASAMEVEEGKGWMNKQKLDLSHHMIDTPGDMVEITVYAPLPIQRVHSSIPHRIYFAAAHTATNTAEETISIPSTDFRLSSLKPLLLSRYPNTNLDKVLEISKWSVDAEMVDESDNVVLKGGEEVAVIPPVSGG